VVEKIGSNTLVTVTASAERAYCEIRILPRAILDTFPIADYLPLL
jgi:hypothetical protein